MTKKEFRRIYAQLDDAKAELYSKGIAFNFIGKDEKANEQWQTGIGTGGDMSELAVKTVASLYLACQSNTKALDGFLESFNNLTRRCVTEYLAKQKKGLN